MAETQFFGIGATGFPDPDTEILPARIPMQTDVQLRGSAPGAPSAGLATQSETFSPSLTPAAEFTEVTFATPCPPVFFSRNPNNNDVLFVVTAESDPDLTVRIYPAPRFEGSIEGVITEPPPVPRDLAEFVGPLSPSGVVGNILQFVGTTGLDITDPIKGTTNLISAYALTAGEAVITVQDAFPVTPTVGSLFRVAEVSRDLRRTPLIEVILGDCPQGRLEDRE